MRIVLASQSPRRQELLHKLWDHFEVVPADINEWLPEEIAPNQAAKFLAAQKACAVAQQTGADIVIGCDTIVACEGEIMGKPNGWADAIRMLKKLSGKTHDVYTGICVITPKDTICFVEGTKVTFCELDAMEIRTYLYSKEPFDKAGAYGIQGMASRFIKKIDGDYFNVVGLPVSRLYQELKKAGLYQEKSKEDPTFAHGGQN